MGQRGQAYGLLRVAALVGWVIAVFAFACDVRAQAIDDDTIAAAAITEDAEMSSAAKAVSLDPAISGVATTLAANGVTGPQVGAVLDSLIYAQAQQDAKDTPLDAPKGRLLADELPPVVVVGEGGLKEEERIGKYAQPRWTAHRRFPTTRIYVRPEWSVEFEYWLRIKSKRGKKAEYEHRQEVEIGLPYRFQLDLYLIETHEGSGEVFFDQSIEIRYALADWGKIFANPTFYFEYVNRTEGRPEKIEVKALFGDELAPRWHWGANVVWEHEMDGEREDVLELTTGLAYSLVDSVLSVGIEGKFEIANTKDNRSDWEENLRLGPSIQWRPTQWLHVDFAPLFGLNDKSSRVDSFLVVGIEF